MSRTRGLWGSLDHGGLHERWRPMTVGALAVSLLFAIGGSGEAHTAHIAAKTSVGIDSARTYDQCSEFDIRCLLQEPVDAGESTDSSAMPRQVVPRSDPSNISIPEADAGGRERAR